jgi:hypothetical protein
MGALIGLHDQLWRSKLLDRSLFQPDDLVADCLNHLHVVRRKRQDIGLIDHFTQPLLRLGNELRVTGRDHFIHDQDFGLE